MALGAVLFSIAFLHALRIANASDACSNITYKTIRDVRRSTAYSATNDLCDRGYIKDELWYRFQSAAGNKMPEENPGLNHCGTYVPIWMNGAHPDQDGKTEIRTACAGLPFTFPVGCGISYQIQVIKCGNFYLYNLKEPDRCSLAYCAGSTLARNCSLDGSSMPVCSGVVPQIENFEANTKEEESEFVRLRCGWTYALNASYVEFHVQWFRDSESALPSIQRKRNGSSTIQSYEELYEHVSHFYPEKNPNGYLWNRKAFCKVRARFHGGKWSAWKSSDTIFTGVAVDPQIINLHQCVDNVEVFLSLRPHLPIRMRPYMFEIKHSDKLSKICLHETLETNPCLSTLTESHTIHTPLWIRITAVCPSIDPGSNSSTVNVTFDGDVQNQLNNNFWTSYKFPPIKITLASENTKICTSQTDPNIHTFDGRWYDLNNVEGTYRLYRNKYSGTEVQARLKNRYNCGVAIKEGLFFKIYDFCSSSSSPVPIELHSYFPDYPKSGFYTEKLQNEERIIHLPSGITVTVKRASWRIKYYDITIKAPKPYSDQKNQEQMHSEGLCGNFNGDKDDDFEGLVKAEFANQQRILSGSEEDIFAYRGDKDLEKQLFIQCKNRPLCVCSASAKSCNSATVIRECFPPEINRNISHHKQDLCRGGRSYYIDGSQRSRRAIYSSDDDVDEQDIIPSYIPVPRNFTTPSWPTPSGKTKDNVTNVCSDRIKHSRAGVDCSTVSGVNIDQIINQCISDVQATDDVLLALANFGALEEICRKNVYKNISYYKNSTDGKLTIDTKVLDSLCPNDCSDRGSCLNSTCSCAENYTAADCSISMNKSPILYGIRNSGLCDRRKKSCRTASIYGYPLLDSENLTCHIQEFQVIDSIWTPAESIILLPGLIVDPTQVKCFLPESPVEIADYSYDGISAAGLMIAVSNNRISASKNSMSFITYDSVCQECNTSTGCKPKNDACLISGHCYAQNESRPSHWCEQCLPSLSTTSWEKRRDNQPPVFTSPKTFYAFYGKEIQVQLNALDPENRTISYTFAQVEILDASLSKNGLFSWIKNTSDPTLIKFNATDECGAFSVLDVTLILQDCECQNSGECLPDHRYLDGAGRFSCLCPPQFTGFLCENDVNECEILTPCVNGNCTNEQPGFSCSCIAGYSGDLCEIEIDECSPHPCFIGVACTDMIATFSCAPCPNGYTGNGVNCSRLDGKIDQCVGNPHVCHNNAACKYNNGSYDCQCVSGYEGDGKIDCTDINECAVTPSGCHQNASCINTDGRYYCKCPVGFNGDGILECSDVDECITPNICAKTANCTNTEGSFFCECLEGYKYTKGRCEPIAQPCNQEPCFPGLTCSQSSYSEGFVCESCPTLFEGDGKKCELVQTKATNILKSKMILTNQNWNDQLNIKTSIVYKKLISQITREVRNVYISIPEFSYFVVTKLSPGSIIVDFDLIFIERVDNPFQPLVKVAMTGKLGNMTFEINAEDGSSENSVWTLSKTILIIAIAAVVIIFVVILGICLHHRLNRMKTKKDTEPKALSYRKQTGNGGEQIDLEVFDNEAIETEP